MQNMKLTCVQPLLLMSIRDHPKDSVIPLTNENQKEQDQENMEDKAIFPN